LRVDVEISLSLMNPRAGLNSGIQTSFEWDPETVQATVSSIDRIIQGQRLCATWIDKADAAVEGISQILERNGCIASPWPLGSGG